ncbi:MAG: zinc-binding protein [Thermodesulfovibrio sp.]|nr:zinc-binding protein [Thermodesulfovibrio sp.]
MKAKSLIVLILIFFIISSCQKKGSDTGIQGSQKLKVVTSLFPLYDFAKNVGREKAEVTLLLPPGMEPHSFEPKPLDILTLDSADVFIFTNKYMEPWVERILKGIDNKRVLIVDSSKNIVLFGESGKEDLKRHPENKVHGGIDPHIWLDFSNALKMVDNILGGFVKKDPANKDFYQKNADEYKARLNEIDKRFNDVLGNCKKDTFINGGHFIFGYLAKRYNLNYISAYGFSPDSEPTSKDLIKISKTLKQYGLNHIFYEELITPRVAETIAKETGAELLMLHGAHNISKQELNEGVTFISLMNKNLENLRVGLQCKQK